MGSTKTTLCTLGSTDTISCNHSGIECKLKHKVRVGNERSLDVENYAWHTIYTWLKLHGPKVYTHTDMTKIKLQSLVTAL